MDCGGEEALADGLSRHHVDRRLPVRVAELVQVIPKKNNSIICYIFIGVSDKAALPESEIGIK